MKSKAKAISPISYHNIYYSRPAQDISDCLLIGNGDIGMNIDFTGMQSHFGYIMKSDVWKPKDTEISLKGLYKLESLISARNKPKLLQRITVEEKNRVKKIIALLEELNKKLEERNKQGWVKIND